MHTFTSALRTGASAFLGVADRSTMAGFGTRTRSGLSDDMLMDASQSDISCQGRKLTLKTVKARFKSVKAQLRQSRPDYGFGVEEKIRKIL